VGRAVSARRLSRLGAATSGSRGRDAFHRVPSGPEEDGSSIAEPLAQNGHGEGQSYPISAAANRLTNRSSARSKIKRDGLKVGTFAPYFHLPRLDGRGQCALSDLRGRRVLLVFSSPNCGPCNTLAPELEKFHRANGGLAELANSLSSSGAQGEGAAAASVQVVMISKGEPRENRAKVKEHRLTFPILLQQQWEISRRYAMFATPIAYLINEAGVIMRDVAVGPDAIFRLMAEQNGHADLAKQEETKS